jgi:hypothetical protein
MGPLRHFLALLSVGSALLLGLAGCASAPLATDRALVTDDPKLVGVAVKDKVLWQYRLALAALRAGRDAEAKARLDDAILTMGGIIANDEAAARARSLWSGESRKVFIGEPYERVMAYYYRGLLYWRDGEPDNARACFRSGQFIDSEAGDQAYRSDYVLLDYLDGLASVRLGADGRDALARAAATAGHPLPEYDPKANVLVFAEWGRGPLKYAAGEQGEQLRFDTVATPILSATLTVDGRTLKLPAYDDLNFQATTRGGRVMDYILGRKAVFKDTAGTVGDVALVGAAVAANQMVKRNGRINHDAENATVALAAIGLISKAVAGAADATADTRTWDNLPQKLGFLALSLAPGEHPAILRFYDAQGNLLAARTRHLNIQVPAETTRDIVVFASDLAKNPS